MNDDRYRLGQTSDAISASLWEVAKEYGITDRIAVDEQVAICKSLATTLKIRSGPLAYKDVMRAFERFGLRKPPPGFARALIARLERLDGAA